MCRDPAVAAWFVFLAALQHGQDECHFLARHAPLSSSEWGSVAAPLCLRGAEIN